MTTPPAYYKLDVANLPENLFRPDVPVEKWLARVTIADSKGFVKNSLNKPSEIPWDVDVERCVGISLYMVGNVLPFLVPGLFFLSFHFSLAKLLLWLLLAYASILWILFFLFGAWFVRKHRKLDGPSGLEITGIVPLDQYWYTERNTTKYLTMNFVWPRSLHPPCNNDRIDPSFFA